MKQVKQWLKDELDDAFSNNQVTSNQALVFVDDLHPDTHFNMSGDSWTLDIELSGSFLAGREKSILIEAQSALTITFPVTPTEFLNWAQHEDNPLGPREEFVDRYLHSIEAERLVFHIADHKLNKCLSGRSLWRKSISEIIRQLLEQKIVPTIELVESICREEPAAHDILEFADATAEVVVRTGRGESKRLDYSQTYIRHIQKVLLNLKNASRELVDEDFSFEPRK